MVGTENLLKSCEVKINNNFFHNPQLIEMKLSFLLLRVERMDGTQLKPKPSSFTFLYWYRNTIASWTMKLELLEHTKILENAICCYVSVAESVVSSLQKVPGCFVL